MITITMFISQPRPGVCRRSESESGGLGSLWILTWPATQFADYLPSAAWQPAWHRRADISGDRKIRFAGGHRPRIVIWDYG